MPHTTPDFLVVGHLSKAHGIKGELYIWPLTDHPESTFSPGVEFRVSDVTGDRPSDFFPSLEIEESRPYKRGWLIKFLHVDDRDEAERLKGRYLMRSSDEVEELAEGEYFYHQLLGLTVTTADGEELGTVQEVYELRPADLLEVRGPKGLLHIPLAAHVVAELDVEEGRIVLDPPEGLLDQ